jgi:uncharacterized membrane protein YukC
MRAGGAPRAFALTREWVRSGRRGYAQAVHFRRRLVTLVAAVGLCAPLAACGEDDVDQAREDVQEQADELKGDLDSMSKEDLQKKLDDAQDAAENGSDETKQKARELENKIERELDERK